MGLAASQARLLSITSRKSDAQFESMRLSHQKLALSRSLTDVSNDYQNALKKTKLYYDFYGNGSTDNILSYNLFMTPSAINNYTPVMITNQQNRIVLSSNLAAAARAAGIPEEGLDGFIDTTTRNKFISVLSGLGEIDVPTANVIMTTEYDPYVGLGSSLGVYVSTETENYSVLMQHLDRTRLSSFQGLSSNDLAACASSTQGTSAISAYIVDDNVNAHWSNGAGEVTGQRDARKITDSENIYRLSDTAAQYYSPSTGQASFQTATQTWDGLSLYDILYGNDDIILTQNVQQGVEVTDALNPNQYDDMLNIVKGVIDLLADEIESLYGVDDTVQLALTAAYANMDAAAWSNTQSPRLAIYTESVDGNDRFYRIQHANPNLEFPGTIGHCDDYGYDNGLDLMQDPVYSLNQNVAHQFTTAEDYDANNANLYTACGYEPLAYWVSVPNTVEQNGTWPDATVYIGNDIWEASQDANAAYNINNGLHSVLTYALVGASKNLALINMYDNSDQEPEEHVVADVGNFGAINLSAFVKAWYTYFMQSVAQIKLADGAMDDAETDTCNWILDNTYVNFHKRQYHDWDEDESVGSHFVTNYVTWRQGENFCRNNNDLSALSFESAEVLVSDGISNIAAFYDTIINQICEYGWTENNLVKEDTSYLQEMLQSGKMFMFTLASDDYYYQKGYATDTFVKEIADETAIAEAEAKYKTQKARINAKEQEIDIKMRNLDTEISALESEYEAVKKMISNNVQKSFTRYQS